MRHSYIQGSFPLFYEFLDEAERLFGKRDETYDIVDILYMGKVIKNEDGKLVDVPHTLYLHPLSDKSLIIHLHNNAIGDIERSYFQMTQEIIRIFLPMVNIKDNKVLNEEKTVS